MTETRISIAAIAFGGMIENLFRYFSAVERISIQEEQPISSQRVREPQSRRAADARCGVAGSSKMAREFSRGEFAACGSPLRRAYPP